MPAPHLLLALAIVGAAGATDDEARIEQLLHPATSVPPQRTAARSVAKADPAAHLLGHKVRVRTVDGGLYAGTLRASDVAGITLRIELPKQAIDYRLPRSGVADIEDAEPAP